MSSAPVIPVQPPESPVPGPSVATRLAAIAGDIKLSHTVFALPYAVLATFLAAGFGGQLPDATTVSLILICMFTARTAAMSFNRWADAGLDVDNPRTAGRAIPSGRLSPGFVLGTAGLASVGFIVTTLGFWLIHGNPWPMVLSPLVLGWLAGYSFTKRVTSGCHLFLGSALAISPLAAVIAVNPGYLTGLEPYLLALVVMCWVGGFDVIYALQDVQIDRQQGLFSLPARFGVRTAVWVSRLLHVLAGLALIMLGYISPQLNQGFAVGIGITIVLLIVEHLLIKGNAMSRVGLAFLPINGLISVVLGTLGVVDIVRHIH